MAIACEARLAVNVDKLTELVIITWIEHSFRGEKHNEYCFSACLNNPIIVYSALNYRLPNLVFITPSMQAREK